MTFLLHKGGTRRGMMPMTMHYYDAEAYFRLTNQSGRLDYQDYQDYPHKPFRHLVSNLMKRTVRIRLTFYYNWRERLTTLCYPSPHLLIKPEHSVGHYWADCKVER